MTVTGFLAEFDYQEEVERVIIDLTHSHIWGGSAVAAIDRVVLRFRKRGVPIDVVGLNEASATLLERLAIHDKAGVRELTPGH